MASTTNYIRTTAEGFVLSDNNLQDIMNVCDETDYDKDYFKDDDDFVELEKVCSENCNGMDKCEDDDGEEERDLTNLTWLTELRNQTISFVNMPSDEEKPTEFTVYEVESQKQVHHLDLLQKSPKYAIEQDKLKILNMPDQKSQELHVSKTYSPKQYKRPSPTERFEMFLNKIKRDFEIYQQSAMNFQSDVTEKPPFNYSHIIGMAMLESGRHVTLQQICSWIEMKFAFFRVRKKWNNSIRHNLSLHPCFRKIGRNKEDKGKGGYWELGVDPKKCDRKRIRNRKTSAHAAKTQSKHLQTYSNASKRSQQHTSKKPKHLIGYLKPSLNNSKDSDYEKLYLDDNNVQQNVEVTSSNHDNNITSTTSFYKLSETHSVPDTVHEQIKMSTKEEDKRNFLTQIINDSVHTEGEANIKEFDECPVDTDHVHSHHMEQSLLAHSCHQEYRLGTVIISTSSMEELANIHNINSNPINAFISTCSIKQLTETIEHTTQQQPQHNNVHTEEEIPENSESEIIASYRSKLTDEEYSKCSREFKSSQCPPASSSSSSTISLDCSSSPAQQIQPRSNVIVEQLMQPSLTLSTVCMSTNASSSSTIALTTTPNRSCSTLLNDNFRPYIDGIDEAFQYLRSIDNTRNGDILDNLLDISVSDY